MKVNEFEQSILINAPIDAVFAHHKMFAELKRLLEQRELSG